MSLLHALPLLLLFAEPEAAAPWNQAGKDDGITVYNREKKGTGLQELKAVGTFDAPPEEVWKVVRDFESYTKVMPYVDISKLVEKDEAKNVLFVYTQLGLPFVDKRDYTIRVTDESEWKDGQGYLKSAWTVANDKGPAPKKDVVRVGVNDGYWKLEPADGGKKTLGTYYLFTDPGGALPKWMVNSANTGAVPDIFKSIRRALKKK
jgi:hypothetical protein